MLSHPEIASFPDNRPPHAHLSNLEKNYNQIFVKAPTLTREFFEKINKDVVPQKTYFFGYQMNTRRFIVITGLSLLFIFSILGTILLWFTDAYQKRIESLLVIAEDSPKYEMWRLPPANPIYKFYIFNYTNVDDFEAGRASKLNVQELGPYTYTEELERVNIRFSKVDGTVSYQQKRKYRFISELSKGGKYDLLTVPNIPVIAGAAEMKKKNFFMRLGFNALLKTLSARPFTKKTVHEFVNGYNDDLYDLAKAYLQFEDRQVFEHFGLLAWNKGTQPDVITVNTGLHDITQMGQVEKFNGQTHYDIWRTDSCNSVKASDGVIYPAASVAAKKNVEFLLPQMCRKVPLKYVGEGRILDKVLVHRYNIPSDFFDYNDRKNECFCTDPEGICPPNGVFNATGCTLGAPFYYSWPHFYGADPKIQESLTGLKKHPVINDSFVDIHPKFGLLMQAKMKLQANIQLQRSTGLYELNGYPDDLILPITWMEVGLSERDLSEDVVHTIYQMTFTIRNLELGLKYGCLLSSIVTMACILLVLKKHRRDKRLHMDSLRRPMNVEDY